MNETAPQDQTYQPKDQLERRLKDADANERKVSSELLELSRPHLVAGRRLPWDNFWAAIARGFDGILWRWFGGDVEVARAQEEEAQRRKTRRASTRPPQRKNNENNDQSTQGPAQDPAQDKDLPQG